MHTFMSTNVHMYTHTTDEYITYIYISIYIYSNIRMALSSSVAQICWSQEPPPPRWLSPSWHISVSSGNRKKIKKMWIWKASRFSVYALHMYVCISKYIPTTLHIQSHKHAPAHTCKQHTQKTCIMLNFPKHSFENIYTHVHAYIRLFQMYTHGYVYTHDRD